MANRLFVFGRRIVVVLASLLIAACGDDNGGGKGGFAPATTPTVVGTPTATGTPGGGGAGTGLIATISSATIDSAGHIVVVFSVTDANGAPLTAVLGAAQSDQQARVRFTVAHIEDYSGGGELATMFSRYVNDINATRPAFDANGTLETVDAGHGVYRYTFATVLPAGFDRSRTYTIGSQVDRMVGTQEFGSDPVFDVVPNGGPVEVRQDVTTQECNSCHNPLIAHGNRREVRLCVLCHTEAAVDAPPPPATPRTLQFKHMIHRLHRGADLPSIVNGPPGANYAIYSSFGRMFVVFAEKDASGKITGIRFPRAIQECGVCHTQAPTAHFAYEKAATPPCTGCHDDVNPSLTDTEAGPPGTNHFQNKGYPEGECAACHAAQQGQEFDITVPGAHVVPERSSQLAGLNVAIVDVTNHAAGQAPTIAFKITDNAGTPLLDLSGLDRVAFSISGPTTDYAATGLTPVAVGGGASGTLTPPDADGVFDYTPAIVIPADASGTWAVGAEARRAVTLVTTPEVSPKTVEEAAPNPVTFFSVDGSPIEPRRIVVEDQHCASCHGEFSKDFSIHGNLRNRTQYCVICHNPNQSDAARRKLDPDAAERGTQATSIDFKVMIHKIHRGENLEQKPYLIFGFGLPPKGFSINDFSDIRFPGDLRDCAKCHTTSPEPTYLLPPFPGTALGTLITNLDAAGNPVPDGRLGPIRSVCTACHDADDAVAHAITMTAPDGSEACPVCHEEGRDFAVSRLHAGRN